MSPEKARIIEHTYSQVPEERRVLGQFPGRRANTMIANAMAIIHAAQGQGASQSTRSFYLEYKQHAETKDRA